MKQQQQELQSQIKTMEQDNIKLQQQFDKKLKQQGEE